VSDTGFTINDLTTLGAGTSSSVKWNCKNGNLAALDSGAGSLSVSTSKVQITSTSITADGYNVPNTFAAGTTWSEKVTVIGTVQTGTRTLDSQIAANLNCTAAGAESITVLAGTFDTVKATCTETIGVSELVNATPIPAGAPSTLDITDWYAKGVGLVKSVRVNNTSTATATSELTQYTIK
jgi:cell division ATPase FtsA